MAASRQHRSQHEPDHQLLVRIIRIHLVAAAMMIFGGTTMSQQTGTSPDQLRRQSPLAEPAACAGATSAPLAGATHDCCRLSDSPIK